MSLLDFIANFHVRRENSLNFMTKEELHHFIKNIELSSFILLKNKQKIEKLAKIFGRLDFSRPINEKKFYIAREFSQCMLDCHVAEYEKNFFYYKSDMLNVKEEMLTKLSKIITGSNKHINDEKKYLMKDLQIGKLEKVIVNDNESISFLLNKLNIVNDLLDIKVKKLEYAYNLISSLTSILDKRVTADNLGHHKSTIIEHVKRIRRDESVTTDIVLENKKFLSNKFSNRIPVVEVENDEDYACLLLSRQFYESARYSAKNDNKVPDLPELIDIPATSSSIEQHFTVHNAIVNKRPVNDAFKIKRRRSRSANVIRKQYPGDINISEDNNLAEDLELINNNNKILYC